MRRIVLILSALLLWVVGVKYFIEHPHLRADFLNRSRNLERAVSDFAQEVKTLASELNREPSYMDVVPAQRPSLPASQEIDFPHGMPAISTRTRCIAPPTHTIPASQVPVVYRWTDEAGAVRYSDQIPPGIQADPIKVGQAPRPQYFLLNIDYSGRNPIPFLRAQIQTDTTRIFQIISGLMGSEFLRQVELNIKIHQDREAFRRHAASTGSTGSANAGGFYTTSTNEAVTYQYPDDKITLAVLRHESVHVIVAGIVGTGTPLWLNEGLAAYFEQLHVAGQYGEVSLNTSSVNLARETLRRGYPARLREFLELGPISWYDSPAAQSHYALAASLVFFLLDSGAGRAAIADLMRKQASAPCSTVEQTGWLAGSYPGGVSGLERDFANWLSSNPAQQRHRY